ncbi:hypothetical protein F4818DRAFT_456829 [Hypoxylon cercidicola]|nr:hypothetical protein F4818DRAFT_456829 [Hypoxylon cercidicola]
MKRRMWNVIRELDLQNAFESGIPTLLHNIDSDVAPPANLDDEDFSETTKELPTPKPLNSTSMITTDSQSTIDLLEQCLPFMEDMYLRCCHGEPWCFVTMCGAIMVLKIHLRKETRQTAKASCALKFLDLHYKRVERQRVAFSNQWYPTPTGPDSHVDGAYCHLITHDAADFPASGWLGSNYSELSIDSFDFDLNMNGAWDIWEPL